MIKTMANITFGFIMFVGLMMMAGSAGDCDGKCMENANTIGEMVAYAAMGLALMIASGVGFMFTNTTD